MDEKLKACFRELGEIASQGLALLPLEKQFRFAELEAEVVRLGYVKVKPEDL